MTDRITDALIKSWFTYHKPTPDQVPKYDRVNAACEALCHLVLEVCPEESEHRDAALHALRRLRMDINLAIACEKPRLT